MANQAKSQAGLLHRLRTLAPGIWIVILVVSLVGGRWLWIRETRPVHGREIADAFGSASLFYGVPQSDRTGKRITYVATDDVGYGVFLCDTATGKKQNVREPATGLEGDTPALRVWPWSPDDSSFAYSDGRRIVFCDAQTGKRLAQTDLPASVAGLTWTSPSAIAYVDAAGKLGQLERQPDGTWKQKPAAEIKAGGFKPRTTGIEAVTASETAGGSDAANAVDGNEATSWFSGRTPRPAWLQYQFSGMTWAVTGYRLSGSADDANAVPRDWQLLGSNDGENWTVLDSQTNQSAVMRGQTRQYEFANETPYWFYRLNLTRTTGGAGSGARVAEFQLFSKDTASVASANAEFLPWQGAVKAFDGDKDSKWYNYGAGTNGWLQYQFGDGAGWAVSEYSMTSANDMPARDPRDWQFQASNDGTNWTTLDRREGEIFSDRFQTKSYTFENSTPYRIYRLKIAATQGTGQGTQLAELDLGLKKMLVKVGNPDGGLAQRNANATVAASGADVAHGFGADKANDRNETTGWFSGKTATAWLQYNFGESAWAITQYKLVSSIADTNTDPRDWQLLASNDGENWTLLDSQTNQMFSSRRQAKRHAISNRLPYRLYRLNITANGGGNESGVRLAEFQLWSDDTPAAVSASAEYLPWQSAAKAFDGDKNTKWFNTGSDTNGWLQYKFGGGEGRSLSRYALTSGNDVPERDPKDWQLLASNDGKTWTTLDTETNQTFETRLQTKSYSFVNRVPYQFFRLNITASQGVGRGLQLAGLDIGANTNAGNAPSPVATISNRAQIREVVPGLNLFANAFSLTALDGQTIAWGQSNCIWSINLASGSLSLLLDAQAVLPANTTLRSFSHSKESGQFLLNCGTDTANSLWRFDPNDAASGVSKIGDSLFDAVGMEGTKGAGWVARKDNYLMVQRDPASGPVRIVPRAALNGFAVSADGSRLFILGLIKNEASAGIWQYDFAPAKLSCVVPYGDKPSPYAKKDVHHNNSLKLPSGQILTYDIFPPANFHQNPHRKYPLVIGYTTFWAAMRGAHGRLWIPALAAEDAYVVIVNRSGWFEGIENWNTNVMAVYNEVTQSLPIDKDRVFLFGASAETSYMRECLEQTPGLWQGAIFLNPTGLPDFSKSPVNQPRPRLLISTGGEEGQDKRFEKYQADALQHGVLVDYIISPKEGHHFIGNAAQYQRTKAITRFIFEE